MQISRHWRMNANRYRLEGFELSNGEKSLQQKLPQREIKKQTPEIKQQPHHETDLSQQLFQRAIEGNPPIALEQIDHSLARRK